MVADDFVPSAAWTVTFSVALTVFFCFLTLTVSLASPALSRVLDALPIVFFFTVSVALTLHAPAHGTVRLSLVPLSL